MKIDTIDSQNGNEMQKSMPLSENILKKLLKT